LVTAPVLSRTWGHGVPGDLEPLPGTAHSYRLRAVSAAGLTCRQGESAPSRIAHSFVRSLFEGQAKFKPVAGNHPFSGSFPPQVSQAKKMKRGLYV
jgi:hypothetical protein